MNPLIPALIGTAINAVQPSGSEVQPAPAQTSLRSIPAQAKKADMQPPRDNIVQLGGKPLRLSPAAQIRSAQNLIMMPSQVQQPAPVRYLTDDNGNVSKIWILTAEEAAQPGPK